MSWVWGYVLLARKRQGHREAQPLGGTACPPRVKQAKLCPIKPQGREGGGIERRGNNKIPGLTYWVDSGDRKRRSWFEGKDNVFHLGPVKNYELMGHSDANSRHSININISSIK